MVGFLERTYKKDVSVKEAIELAKESLKAAIERDNASGNGIDVFTITKDGGDGAGQGMYGGVLYVKGSTNSRTGQIMKNGTILVGGNAGFMTGLYMMGGRIIVVGGLGESAGESIIGGIIYFGGKYESLGKNTKVSNISGEEEQELRIESICVAGGAAKVWRMRCKSRSVRSLSRGPTTT
jgi:glutamate synthase domain-containing protein 3